MPITKGRRAMLLAAGVMLPLPVLTGCSSDDDGPPPPAAWDIAAAPRAGTTGTGTLRWAVDATPTTLNAFSKTADTGTERIAGAVLPSLYTLDARGRPQRNGDYLASADVTSSDPKQVVVYKLNPKAVWSDGRPLGVEDFQAQWRALRGTDDKYGTARNAGYDRIAKVEPGDKAHEVKVTFAKPYTDWRSLFTPLYPKSVMGNPAVFSAAASKGLAVGAGPFMVRQVSESSVTLVRNPRWWGDRARLNRMVFQAVPAEKRAQALIAGQLDLAEVDPATARRIRATAPGKQAAGADQGSSAPGKAGAPEPSTGGRQTAGAQGGATGDTDKNRSRNRALSGFTLRKALDPAYTQLALNGTKGPLADERVRRAVARAIDRKALAKAVLKPMGLPSEPLGNHLLMAGQPGYKDHSGALGDPDKNAAQSLLADAGWRAGGTGSRQKALDGKTDDRGRPHSAPTATETDTATDTATEGTSGTPSETASQSASGTESANASSERSAGTASGIASGTASSERSAGAAPAAGDAGRSGRLGEAAVVRKKGRPLVLRFVLPDDQAGAQLSTVGRRIARMLEKIGVRTEITKVSGESYFRDHIATGDYDLALYSWPASAYPATDARPIYAKPQPAADGSLVVEQNYTRVGTDQIDQLFDQALSELDGGASRSLVSRADARIWAAAGSIPLYQRPQLIAMRKGLVNAGAFGFATPRYQDIGFRR
ncbi:ABC transporter family substrate-binding protein [Streptomyces malaysiensis subsp. malaysiensis]|uniref:ABC transporter family substrate-binding protein n=1 Tax=Streptomyces malaysiensis TaxID=92644 RepID=UPI000BFDB363|nr:ABC transporter family substrate-binding protein [Streptomyces malaysiensis]QDL70955.1 ABC transporter family substrate-binding protein [Streptomyces malaysiensis]